jgi:hypothetical protein
MPPCRGRRSDLASALTEVRSDDAHLFALGDAETVAIRRHVVLGAIWLLARPDQLGMRGSRRHEPRDEALRHLVGLTRHILDVGVAVEEP